MEKNPSSVPSPGHADDDSRSVLDSIRRIVQLLRRSDTSAEKTWGLSAAQLFVLHKLSDVESISVGELAGRTLTSQSSVSEVVQKLVAAGLVSRTKSRRDGRSVELSLTEPGRIIVSKVPMAPQVVLLGGLKRMPPRDRSQLARLLVRLVKETGMTQTPPSQTSDTDGGELGGMNPHEPPSEPQ